MAKKSIHQRNEEQRLRQSQIRKTAMELRRPSRDDLARMLLWQMITLAQKADDTNKQQALDGLDFATRPGAQHVWLRLPEAVGSARAFDKFVNAAKQTIGDSSTLHKLTKSIPLPPEHVNPREPK